MAVSHSCSQASLANEELVGEALAPFHNQVVIATKFGEDVQEKLRPSTIVNVWLAQCWH
jgi:aryl-alcohol dehydrogenase-like predicted oxidoreductase